MDYTRIKEKRFAELLASPCCLNALIFSRRYLVCAKCKAKYRVEKGRPVLVLPQTKSRFGNYLLRQEEQIFYFEKWPMVRLFFPPSETLRIVNKEKELVAKLGPKALILNIGSSRKGKDENVVCLNVDPSVEVDVVADAHRLPFFDKSFDLVICRFVLEHVQNPARVVSEIYRVLKKGGVVYVDVPFLQPHHDSPFDFQRLTLSGLKDLMSDFSEIESGISAGPASALSWMMREFPGLIFENKFLFRFSKFVFGWLVFPLKYLDFILMRKKRAYLLSSAFYFVGRKKA